MWGPVTQRGASLALGFGMQRFQRKEDESALVLGIVNIDDLLQTAFKNDKLAVCKDCSVC